MGSRERSIGNILTKYAHGSSQNMASSRGFFKNWDVNYELKGGQNKREHCRKMNRKRTEDQSDHAHLMVRSIDLMAQKLKSRYISQSERMFRNCWRHGFCVASCEAFVCSSFPFIRYIVCRWDIRPLLTTACPS